MREVGHSDIVPVVLSQSSSRSEEVLRNADSLAPGRLPRSGTSSPVAQPSVLNNLSKGFLAHFGVGGAGGDSGPWRSVWVGLKVSESGLGE